MAATPQGWASNRITMWLEEDLDLGLPGITGVEYLREWMSPDQLGWCHFDGMGGAGAHSWAEVGAFSRMTGGQMEPWEARQVRAMSVAYVEGMAKGGEPMKVSPAYLDTPKEDPGMAVERRRISAQIKAGFSAMVEKGQ